MGEKPKFKVGDKVRVIGNSNHNCTSNGTELTIRREEPGCWDHAYRVSERDLIFMECDLELISKAPSKAILNKYHFFHSESNPLDIQRVADENPEAIGGVVLVKGGDEAIVWLRQRFIDKFYDDENVEVADENLDYIWGTDGKVDHIVRPDRYYHNGLYNDLRVKVKPSEQVQQVIAEIKAAKKFLAEKEANMKKAEEEQKEETKVKPKEPRTKITVLTF